jgi:hypothetical protein
MNNKTYSNYILIESDDVNDFENKVNFRLEEGYDLLWGTYENKKYIQALCKIDRAVDHKIFADIIEQKLEKDNSSDTEYKKEMTDFFDKLKKKL